jgi:hypothetical protein
LNPEYHDSLLSDDKTFQDQKGISGPLNSLRKPGTASRTTFTRQSDSWRLSRQTPRNKDSRKRISTALETSSDCSPEAGRAKNYIQEEKGRGHGPEGWGESSFLED